MRRYGRLAALRQPDFRWFFAGQATSLLGDGMAGTALAFAVLGLHGHPGDLGLVLAARTLPLLAFMLAGGVIADRFPRRAVMLGADLARCASQGAVAVLLLSGHAGIGVLAGSQVIQGIAAASFLPAVNGMTRSLVQAEHRQQANSLQSLALSVGAIAGPLLSGLLVVAVGPGWVIGVDAATYAVSAFCLWHLPRVGARVSGQSLTRDLAEGWTAFRSRRWVWAVIVAAAVTNMLFAAFSVLGPAVCAESFGGARSWSLVLAGFGLGSLGGSLLALRLRPAWPLRSGLPLFALMGAPLVALAAVPALPAMVPALPAVVLAALVCGVGMIAFNTLWDTLLQQRIPGEVLSRVTSFEWFGSYAGQPLGLLLCAPAMALAGVPATLWFAGTALVLIALAPLLLRDVRTIRAEEADPEPGRVKLEPTPEPPDAVPA